MSALRTTYEFTLPRGYVDDDGMVHRTGTMRLATARDELEPLRDPRVTGPDDPRLTVLVLARVISKLGDLPQVTMHEIEGLFAVDLAYLQDFYGVINFGNQAEFDALVQAQMGTQLVVDQPSPERTPAPETVAAAPPVIEDVVGEAVVESRPTLRHAVEELPRKNG
ncbi:hypothetical protein KVF89_09355 [Nocardioides carbamazepini]|uniref:hypothetical protein n=1 Tax=Nocardioides carbamazepini TaxID=2854259 RepID=UPI00214A4105|nr:hypothetical protein [Nocardioides carbamazepini]MCR1782738.1 hypothetical protein [Nocardioides carbamazepini]